MSGPLTGLKVLDLKAPAAACSGAPDYGADTESVLAGFGIKR